MIKKIIKNIWVLLLLATFVKCKGDEGLYQYDALVKSELAKGKRVDTIFFDIHFGMTNKEFFTYCWEMNKKGVFTDGRSNTAVLYQLNHNELKAPASMNFYPELEEGRINKMSATLQYDAWAPWNKKLYSDSLATDVIHLFKKWYGENDFIKIDKRESPVYVKVDGNRRILIRRADDKDLLVEYTDLLNVEKNKK